MARQVRIEYAGARYHVMSRGNRRGYILGGDDDKKLFLDTLAETFESTGWLIHSYVLMGNHFHLLVETPEANLSAGMRKLQGVYGTRYNRRHGLVGHVWQGRYKSPVISEDGDEHFLAVSDYIHLNPVVSGRVLGGGERLLDYPWSSLRFLCGVPSKRPTWLKAENLLRAYELPGDTSACRRKYRERMEWKCQEALRGELDETEEELRRDLLRGWYIGDIGFRDRMKDWLETSVHGKKSSYTGAAKKQHDEDGARKLIYDRLKRLGMTLVEMQEMKPGRPEKQMMATLLRKRTTMTRPWVVHELGMGSESSVYNAVKAVDRLRGKMRQEWETFQK